MAHHEWIKQRALELYQGCSATKALEELKKEAKIKLKEAYLEADMPNERTIRRWRNEHLRMRHYEKMAVLAELLRSGFTEVYQNSKRGNQFDTLEYSFYVDGYGYGVNREWLGSKLSAQIESIIEQYPSVDWESFSPHIIEEFPEIDRVGLVLFAKANPYELLQTLERMATKGSFKGKCPTCQHLS